VGFSFGLDLGRLGSLKHTRSWGNASLLAIDLLIVFGALRIGNHTAWQAAYALLCVSGLLAWRGNTRRQRLVFDIPTSRIASAAQGYVELSGIVEQHPDELLLAKLSETPCVWYRYQIEKKDSDGDWRVQEFGESDQTFLIADPTGSCVVDPKGAEITTWHRDVWARADHRYTEYLLLPNDDLYALGEFTTLAYNPTPQETRQQVGDILAEWKSDRAALLRRFDANGDNELDLPEWEKAREAAAEEVRQAQQARAAGAPLHVLGKPTSGRPFLLSNLGSAKLGHRYRLWAWTHLAIFVAACVGFAYVALR
jgi:hypothetical protein